MCSAVSSGSEASGLGSEEDRLDKKMRVLWEEAPQPPTLLIPQLTTVEP